MTEGLRCMIKSEKGAAPKMYLRNSRLRGLIPKRPSLMSTAELSYWRKRLEREIKRLNELTNDKFREKGRLKDAQFILELIELRLAGISNGMDFKAFLKGIKE